MSDMGTFYTSIGLEHPARRGPVVTLPDVLVDTGAEATWVPREVLEALDPRTRQMISAGPIVTAGATS